MQQLIIIAAWQVGTLGIGRKNELPWPKIKSDLERFKNETEGFPCIMGSNTFWSLPPNHRPLKDRLNIVVTRNLDGKDYPNSVKIASSIDEAIQIAFETGKEKLFFTGGSGIYKEVMERSLANTLLGTIVFTEEDTSAEPCDTFFPKIGKEWRCIHPGKKGLDEYSGIPIQFLTFTNSKKPIF